MDDTGAEISELTKPKPLECIDVFTGVIVVDKIDRMTFDKQSHKGNQRSLASQWIVNRTLTLARWSQHASHRRCTEESRKNVEEMVIRLFLMFSLLKIGANSVQIPKKRMAHLGQIR